MRLSKSSKLTNPIGDARMGKLIHDTEVDEVFLSSYNSLSTDLKLETTKQLIRGCKNKPWYKHSQAIRGMFVAISLIAVLLRFYAR